MNWILLMYQIPTIENKEDIGVVSVLVFLVTILCAAIVYIYKTKNQEIKDKEASHKADIKDKEAQLTKVIEDHFMDVKTHKIEMKEVSEDYKELLKDYYKFVEQAKEIFHVKR